MREEREEILKLQLKKGFLLPEHVKAAQNKPGNYLWRLNATNETQDEVHEEFTNLTFEEALFRAKEMLGKKTPAKKIIAEVIIFGNVKHAPVCYWNKFVTNKDPNKTGTHSLTVTL
ncbi:MAG: hypothetical protein NTZ13_00130 [Candidatus Parcubacteria bacterium]|nr:hypothetical protein [Candidatus Parcubacteria bacterium]